MKYGLVDKVSDAAEEYLKELRQDVFKQLSHIFREIEVTGEVAGDGIEIWVTMDEGENFRTAPLTDLLSEELNKVGNPQSVRQWMLEALEKTAQEIKALELPPDDE